MLDSLPKMAKEEKKKETVITDQELKEMLSKIHVWQDSMQSKFENLLGKVGKTSQELDTFFANRDNFSDKEWARIEKHRKELEEKLMVEPKKLTKKKKQKGDKKRKGKTLGDRKGWMKM